MKRCVTITGDSSQEVDFRFSLYYSNESKHFNHVNHRCHEISLKSRDKTWQLLSLHHKNRLDMCLLYIRVFTFFRAI